MSGLKKHIYSPDAQQRMEEGTGIDYSLSPENLTARTLFRYFMNDGVDNELIMSNVDLCNKNKNIFILSLVTGNNYVPMSSFFISVLNIKQKTYAKMSKRAFGDEYGSIFVPCHVTWAIRFMLNPRELSQRTYVVR